ncbi:nascent polypeptide-associated complex subunit alpha, muscle-specific form-like [Fopius arisanus]|uniref:Nascent polypeptide-associated complex subunit alpha, muscle-specific form-like n=1 Tax=Fopius arisanus TaxID=64838 RepID=A0A9R1U7Q3_9HYME|nr:PREDICTED: nascent polypeptide-associated complex subunit alpha, muscle-specific form-like [Fopius arisanus]
MTGILDELRQAHYITTLDLSQAYFEIPLDPDARETTVFAVPGRGSYHFLRMPYDLTNAPATFQRLLDRLIGQDMYPQFFVYLDDIIFVSETLAKHLELLGRVLDRIKTAGLTINREKSEFCCSQAQPGSSFTMLDGIGPTLADRSPRNDSGAPGGTFPRATPVKEHSAQHLSPRAETTPPAQIAEERPINSRHDELLAANPVVRLERLDTSTLAPRIEDSWSPALVQPPTSAPPEVDQLRDPSGTQTIFGDAPPDLSGARENARTYSYGVSKAPASPKRAPSTILLTEFVVNQLVVVIIIVQPVLTAEKTRQLPYPIRRMLESIPSVAPSTGSASPTFGFGPTPPATPVTGAPSPTSGFGTLFPATSVTCQQSPATPVTGQQLPVTPATGPRSRTEISETTASGVASTQASTKPRPRSASRKGLNPKRIWCFDCRKHGHRPANCLKPTGETFCGKCPFRVASDRPCPTHGTTLPGTTISKCASRPVPLRSALERVRRPARRGTPGSELPRCMCAEPTDETTLDTPTSSSTPSVHLAATQSVREPSGGSLVTLRQRPLRARTKPTKTKGHRTHLARTRTGLHSSQVRPQTPSIGTSSTSSYGSADPRDSRNPPADSSANSRRQERPGYFTYASSPTPAMTAAPTPIPAAGRRTISSVIPDPTWLQRRNTHKDLARSWEPRDPPRH